MIAPIITYILKLAITFLGLAKVAIFNTNVDAENQTLINHKCVCGALNRHFCQTAVSCCLSFVHWLYSNLSPSASICILSTLQFFTSTALIILSMTFTVVSALGFLEPFTFVNQSITSRISLSI